MIVLDTHIWIWWVHDDSQLPTDYKTYIQSHEVTGLGISIISLWEVAKLVEGGRLILPLPVREWLDQATNYSGIRILELTPDIIIDSTQLPGTFHRDPADQLIVATARVYSCPVALSTARFEHTHMCRISHSPPEHRLSEKPSVLAGQVAGVRGGSCARMERQE